jgi:hypothetical protein
MAAATGDASEGERERERVKGTMNLEAPRALRARRVEARGRC